MSLIWQNATVVGGGKGYVPYYNDPPNDPAPQHIDNGKPILIFADEKMTPEEVKDQRHSGYGKIYDPTTKAYLGYMEMTHIQKGALVTDPAPQPNGDSWEISGTITVRKI